MSTKDDDCIVYKDDLHRNHFSCENIVKLDLPHSGLSELPGVLKACVKLKSVDLSYNCFQHVPSLFMDAFPELEHFDISHNKLREFSTPVKSKKLCLLNVSYNILRDLPHWLWSDDHCNLEYLDLSGNNRISYNKIDETVIHVRTLKMVNADFDATLLPTMPNLANLFLGENDEYNSNKLPMFPVNVNHCRNLHSAKLCNISVYDLNENINVLQHLVELDLRFNQVTWLPSSFDGLCSLEVCLLSNNHIIMLPESIGKLEKLKKFHIANNQLGSLPDSFRQLVNIEELDLYNNFFKEVPYILLDKLIGYDFEQNFFVHDCSDYVGMKQRLRDTYVYTGRIDGRRPDDSIDDSTDSEQDQYSSSSSTDENLNVEIEGTIHNGDLIDLEEQWESESNDDYWEPSQEYFSIPSVSPETQWNNYIQIKVQEGHFCPGADHVPPTQPRRNGPIHIEEGQFSDDE